MADLDDFYYTDLIDDVNAACLNDILAATLRAEYSNVETIAATKTLTDGDTPIQVLTPDGANRDVVLATVASTNHATFISNPATSSYDLIVKSGATTLATLVPGNTGLFISTGTTWHVVRSQSKETTYRLSPTVASGNLTLAITHSDGSSPSAARPLTVVIGGVERQITTALSVTKNAGTNWCNSGGAELANMPVDYFVYLGYNAVDGIVIGFARFPYAGLYSNFSTSATNEKYGAISTITNAASGDPYTVIGRFGAILSGGAGYTWTALSYTNQNLKHYPVFETRLLDYTPAITYQGGTTDPTSNTVSHAKYRIIGTDFRIHVQSALVRGSGDRSITIFSLPWTTFFAGTAFPVNVLTSITAAGIAQGSGYMSSAGFYFYAITMANDGTYYGTGVGSIA